MLSELWSDLRYRLRALLRPSELDRELDAELRFHLDQETAKYQRQGMSRSGAHRQARLAVGNVGHAREVDRDVRGVRLIESVGQDLRYALRGLRARPAFTVGVVLTLALAIGANAAMFGVIDRLFFRPPAYLHDPASVHAFYWSQTEDREQRIDASMSVGRYLDLTRETGATLSAVVGHGMRRLAVGDSGAVREYSVAAVGGGYFSLFDMRPALGRFLTPADDQLPSGNPVAVLSHAYWQSELGGRPDVIGSSLHIGQSIWTVVGVAPADFTGIDDGLVPAIYIPLLASAWSDRPEDHTHDYHWQWFQLAVRRKPGVSVAAATADLTRAFRLSRINQRPGDPELARTVAAEHPTALLAPVEPGRRPQGNSNSQVIAWLGGVALIVLLIASANVANLLLARSLARRREIGLRLALGVTRGRLVRQLLTESLLLSLTGGAAGLLVAQLGGGMLHRFFLTDQATGSVLADHRLLGVTLVVTLAVAMLTGLAPALQALRSDLVRSLTAAGRDGGVSRSSLRTGLLIFQATLSVVLLVGAGLFVRSLINVQHLRLGYDVDPVDVVTVKTRGARPDSATQVAFDRRLAEQAAAMPGVTGASPVSSVPFWAYEGHDLFVDGIDSVSVLGDFIMQAGSPDYFRVMGTRILRGRGFEQSDRLGAPRVMVVSAGMARAIWPGQNPLGKCVRIKADSMPCTTVVGVSEDLRVESVEDSKEYTYYIPFAQYDNHTGMVLVRGAGDRPLPVDRVRQWLERAMPPAVYVTVEPLRGMVDGSMASWRLGATMFLIFGALALVLAAVGLYSVIAYGVVQRRREIAVRIALGSPRLQVVILVVRGGVQLVLCGVVLGSLVAAAAGRWVGPLLFHESATDPMVYGAVAAVLLLVSWVATALPALTAARVDPNTALRAE